jgi:hypothetical protein
MSSVLDIARGGSLADMEDHVRASDEDRDRAAQSLREHFAAGRLSQEELDTRLQAAYRASTTSELRAVLRDLPLLPATPQQQRAEHVARRSQLQRRLLQQTGGAIGVFLVCTVIWLASGASGMFWPIWIALVALIPLVRGGWELYGPAPDLDRVERELESRDRHGRRRHRRHLPPGS